MPATRYLAKFLSSCALIIYSSPLVGAEFNQKSDILGFNLDMTGSEVLQALQSRGAKVKEKTKSLASQYFKQQIVVLYEADVTSPKNQDHNKIEQEKFLKEQQEREAFGLHHKPPESVGQFGRDNITIVLNIEDQSKKILALERVVQYTTEEMPSTKIVVEALIEKYGQPLHRKGDKEAPYEFEWYYPSTDKIDMLGCDSVATMVVEGHIDFISNRIRQYVAENASACGQYLRVSLSFSGSESRYISEMTARLVDVRRAIESYRVFTERFWSASEQAKRNQDEEDKKKKPPIL
jgi:hypothetical protein